jgi:hypothetical protein
MMTSYIEAVEKMIDQHNKLPIRIEELEARNKELTLQLLAAHGQAADALDKLVKAEKELNISRMANVVMDNTVEELGAKLDKAGTVALETILNDRGPVFDAMVDAAEDAAGKDVSFNVVVGRAIRAALAELEKKE